MKDGIFFIVYLRWGRVARKCLSALFDFCLNSVNSWLCTSSDVEADFNYLLLKKACACTCSLLSEGSDGD
jgi:hypothetical protein